MNSTIEFSVVFYIYKCRNENEFDELKVKFFLFFPIRHRPTESIYLQLPMSSCNFFLVNAIEMLFASIDSALNSK